jgi:hypothetical protein
MKTLPRFALTLTLACILWSVCVGYVQAQQELSVMLGMDYGIPINRYGAGRDILHGKFLSRQFNMNAGLRYRVGNRVGIEGGIGQSIRTMRMGDNQFEDEAQQFRAVMRSKNHYITGFVGLQGYAPLNDGDFFVFGGGVMWNNVGTSSISATTTYVRGDETLTIDNSYLGRNRSYYAEIGYEGSEIGRNRLYIGAKVNIGESALVQGQYLAQNDINGGNYTDSYIDKGTYVGLNIKYDLRVWHKDKVEQREKPRRRGRKPEPEVIEVVKPIVPQMQVGGRDVKVDGEIKSMAREITVNVWDSQTQDGDTISVYLNGEVLLGNIALQNAKLEFKATLQPGKNYLVLYAHNLGKYPPNTAAITVNDGVKQRQVVVQSTLKTSGSVEITLDE